MNIEIANRLLGLRKEHKLSQEELAKRLNISRQAVSKWERAEASPDTDNLIELSKLYGISLDQLLTGNDADQAGTAESQADSANKEAENTQEEASSECQSDHVSFRNGIHVRSAKGDKVDIGFSGIHVEDSGGEKVHIGLNGIHVSENKGNGNGPSNHIFQHDDYDWDQQYKKQMPYKFWYAFPYPVIAVILFFIFGVCGGWAWSWLMFLTIPIYYTTITAIQKANPHIFCYPVLAAIVFFILGFWGGLWHPGWIVFLTIPFYYWLAEIIRPKDKVQNAYFSNNSGSDGNSSRPNML